MHFSLEKSHETISDRQNYEEAYEGIKEYVKKGKYS
jgi:hypothetical protein